MNDVCKVYPALMLIVAVLALGVGANVSVGQSGRTRGAPRDPISVRIQVVDFAGDPIAEAPVEVASSRQTVFGFTDVDGVAVVALHVSKNDTIVTTRMSHGGATGPVPSALRSQAIDRFHVLRQRFAFPLCQLIDITVPAPISHTIVAGEAVKVSGRLVDGSGTGRSTVIAARGSQAYDVITFNEEGVFEVGGVRRGRAETLWIGGDTSQVHARALAAAELRNDLSLGDIAIVDTPRDATISLTVVNFEGIQVDSKAELRFNLSFVAADDGEVHQFGYSMAGVTYSSPTTNAPTVPGAMIPAGTYYIVPGGLGTQPCEALFDLVRAGKQAELDAAGVTKVTVKAGEVVPAQLDAAAGLAAILGVAGDSSCPCACPDP